MNVICVMSDSFRRDHVGAFGNAWIKTPALDRFATQSTVFSNWRFASYPTIPIRTDLYTGRFTHIDRPWQPLKKDDVILPEILQQAGISTYLAGDTPHIFRQDLSFMRGFDAFHWTRGSEGDLYWSDWYTERDYQSPTGKGHVRRGQRDGEKRYKCIWSQGQRRRDEIDWQTPQTFQAAMEWLTRNARRNSFFLYIDTFDPHEPWDPPQWLTDLYDPDYNGRPFTWAEYGSARQYGKKELKQLQALYAGECSLVDRWFGRLLDTVDLLGLDQNTLVLFMSDHGHYLGYPNDGGMLGKVPGWRKRDGAMASADADVFTPLLDSVSNPILMARLPKQQNRRTSKAMVQPPDVMPTVLRFMGLPVPGTVQGQSFLPLMRGKKASWRKDAVSAWGELHGQISDTRWLYGVWNHPGHPKLYDRKSDPNQQNDVLRKHPDMAKRLHKRMIQNLEVLGKNPETLQRWNNKLKAALQ